MKWQFSNDAPIYSQLIAQIKVGIVSGAFPPGERLPSVRDLATEAGVNPNTMQRALTELERDGLVYSQRTTGRFVTEDQAMIASAKRSLAERHIQAFLEAMTHLGYGREEILTLLLQETALALHLLQQGQIAFSQLSQLLLPLQLPATLLLQPQPFDQQPQKAAGGQRCSGTCNA